MLKKTAVFLLFITLCLAVLGSFLTKEFEVEQSIEIKADANLIHLYVNDLKQWPKWTPWHARNQDLKITYGNVTRGVGATQSWKSKQGNGRLKITVSSPANGIAYDIYFENNQTPSISAIQYQSIADELTRVTWRIHGEVDVPIIGSYIAMFVEHITSDMYQTGLQNIKLIVEKKNTS